MANKIEQKKEVAKPKDWIVKHLHGMLGCPYPGGAADIKAAIEWFEGIEAENDQLKARLSRHGEAS